MICLCICNFIRYNMPIGSSYQNMKLFNILLQHTGVCQNIEPEMSETILAVKLEMPMYQ